MQRFIIAILATAACLLILAAPTAVAASELPADAAVAYDIDTPTVIPLTIDFAAICDGAVGTGAGPCDDEWSKFLWSTGICIVGTLPFGIAWKILKSIKKAAALGGGLVGVMGAIGAYFCYDTWQNYWDWRDCTNPDGDGGGDMVLGPLTEPRRAPVRAVA